MAANFNKNDIAKKRMASIGLFLAPLIFLVLLLFSCLVHEWKAKEIGYTAILGFAGVVLGSGIGFLLAPEAEEENKKFVKKVSVPVLAFFAGYLVSLLEPTIVFLIQDELLIKKPEYGIRFLIFVICLVISIINMYIYRKYLDDFARLMEYEPEKEEKP